MMTRIAHIISRILNSDERRERDKERRRAYHTMMAEQLFNIVQRGTTNYITYDGVFITTDYERNDLTAKMINLRKKYVEHKMNEND